MDLYSAALEFGELDQDIARTRELKANLQFVTLVQELTTPLPWFEVR